MSDPHKGFAATPPATLEEQIMSPCVPKNEREWWAHREIERLRAELAIRPTKCAGVGDSKCDYLAVCGRPCNKCGRTHDGQRTPFARESDEIERLRTELAERKCVVTGCGMYDGGEMRRHRQSARHADGTECTSRYSGVRYTAAQAIDV